MFSFRNATRDLKVIGSSVLLRVVRSTFEPLPFHERRLLCDRTVGLASGPSERIRRHSKLDRESLEILASPQNSIESGHFKEARQLISKQRRFPGWQELGSRMRAVGEGERGVGPFLPIDQEDRVLAQRR